MSPEIFKNKPYSYKSDVWALGCVLYELTTLNHAFDANSLNGLATKIVKGKYPPISPKYSKNLSELIAQMLMLNPQQRPDLDQILRKPFIKKHVVNFFVDIAARPSASIGEGTMIFKAAAGGPASGSVMNDSNMLSLRNQLQSLDMMSAVQDALQPKAAPQDDEQALKLAREQASALKREQEHKKMVEAALEKLRLERESRAKQRDNGSRAPQSQKVPAAGGAYGARRDDAQKRPAPAPIQTPQPAVAARPNAAPVPEPARRVAGRSDENLQGRRRSYGEDRDRIIERERRAADEREKKIVDDRRKIAEQEERRRLLEQQEERRRLAEQEAARARAAEDRRREEVRAEARAREEARLREEAKQREEQAERMRMEQVREKAEQAARAKREALREKEKDRQRMEIEQLKRDKLELDRRTQERERQRDERRAQERGRLDAARRDQFDVMQEKLEHMNDQINQISKLDLRRAEEKNEDNISARERAYISRRQEKAAKEEAERLEALREAENENRRIRAENRSKMYGEGPSGRSRVSDPYGEEQPGYEFDAAGRNRPKARGMDAEELQDRLEEATKGRSRFEDPKNSARGSDVGSSSKSNVAQKHSNLAGFGSDSGEEEEDEWEKGGNGNAEEEDEDLHRREEELKAELNFATMRVEELKRTLQETKSFLGPRLPTRGQPQPAAVAPMKKEPTYDDDEFEDDEELFESEGDYEVILFTFVFYSRCLSTNTSNRILETIINQKEDDEGVILPTDWMEQKVPFDAFEFLNLQYPVLHTVHCKTIHRHPVNCQTVLRDFVNDVWRR